MKASSLSIALQSPCNASCPYCISKTTYKVNQANPNKKILASLPRVIRYMQFYKIGTAMITGSGEPTLNEYLSEIINILSGSIPVVELQTNGSMATRENLQAWVRAGLNTISISISDPNPKVSREVMGIKDESFDFLKVAREASELGLLVRLSLNMAQRQKDLGLPGNLFVDEGFLRGFSPSAFESVVDLFKEHKVHQLTLRTLGLPPKICKTERAEAVIRWIEKYTISPEAQRVLYEVLLKRGTFLRDTPYGDAIFDFKGLSVCLGTCLTEKVDSKARTLILQPDGHVYHSWTYEGSSIF